MSNHSENLDIKDSVGLPPGLQLSNSSANQAVQVKVTQDISTFGIAGPLTGSPPPQPLAILEIGAGTGYINIALAKRVSPGSILTDLEEVVPLMTKMA
ncbi:hypothetical protein DFQ27_004351 [Actinomortierella ambigua]|uniref:Uncharacterized protein n=1 Tax=Actinomortierella ambigua TaxID=1343610 RepID=A0A9P6Q6E0_9FUNG|nr:hypothetical protein DFQ27_004351 [Actinomortierella ambigua]